MSWLERLARLPGGFDFHVALRRFDAASPDLPPLGEAERPADEPVRLAQTPSASFEGAAVTAFASGDGAAKPRLSVGFFGLWGPNGPLPLHLTEYAYERLRHGADATLARFADVFHHRLLLLFHRAWSRTQPTVSMDRPDADRFALYVGALMGLGLKATRNRGGTHDHTKLYYAPWFSPSSRPAEGLRAIVSDHFGVPARIEQFVGEWLDLPEGDRWRLRGPPLTSSLGRAVVGRRVWSRAHKFRVALGPLGRPDLQRMLPGSPELGELSSLVRLYTGDEWAWEIRLVFGASARSPMRLGRGDRLGWTTRIGSEAGFGVDLIVDPSTGTTRRAARPARTPSSERS